MDILLFKTYALFLDKYGNESREQAMQFGITREVYEKINWGNVEVRRLGEILDSEDGCTFSLHPALAGAYAQWVTGR